MRSIKRLLAVALLALASFGASAQLSMTGAGKKPSAGGGGSSVAYRGTVQSTNVASGTAHSAITGHAIGDSMYCQMSNSAAITADSNWTTLDNTQDGNTGVYQYIARRIATTSNGLGADQCNPTYAGTSMGMYIFSFSGVDATAHEQFGLTQWAGSTATVFPPNATPVLNDSIHIVGYAEASGPQTITTDPTSVGYSQIVTNIAGASRVGIYYKKLTGQASTAQGPINLVWAGVAYGPAWTAVAR